MPGTAFADEYQASMLTPGETCIVVVDEVNSPTGAWWGVVVESRYVEGHRPYLSVQARITGRFELDRDWHPVRTQGAEDVAPGLHYRVFPDTETTRNLLWAVELERRKVAEARRDAAAWRRTHLETMEHLARRGLAREEET